MLASLSIRDVVLIDRLDIAFAAGLGVLTGETGAGKSILLDSLGLVLGARADSGLLRRGAAQLAVTATFDIGDGHPARHLLTEQDLDAEPGEALVLRRVVGCDGRSRAFVNDQAVSVGLLRRLGEHLVEIHGQFESHSLLDAANHRSILDGFGGTRDEAAAVAAAWRAWREAATARREAEEALAQARRDEELLRHSLGELEALDPRPGEEEDLAERRRVLMHGERLAEALNEAFALLTRNGPVEDTLQSARRALERVADKAQGVFDAIVEALDRAAVEAAEAAGMVERASSDIDLDPASLEAVEERLFALRAAGRKHGVEADALPALRQELWEQIQALDAGADDIAHRAAAEAEARRRYVEAARGLSRARAAAAARLDAAVAVELPPLKLDKARFETEVEPLPEEQWGPEGCDRVAFRVATNPGAAPGPLHKIASGGELARFMLALKVVLARIGTAPTIVFDEVDAGIGGAVAAAVGERLARLAGDMQVLVVTHSPQVAARGHQHWRVRKAEADGATVTRVDALEDGERREEIARMLAGATVTDEARAAADSLLEKA